MDSSTLLPTSRLSFSSWKPQYYKTRDFSFTPWRRGISRLTNYVQCQKMFVPGFGEASPEAQAARQLHDFFTYVAVKIIKSQLEDYNREAYVELMEFLKSHPLNDGDKFCAELMRESSRHKALALRILEVRSAYCKMDFEWDNLQRLASEGGGRNYDLWRVVREFGQSSGEVDAKVNLPLTGYAIK